MQIMNGYSNDLGTGLQTGDEIGCAAYSGLTLRNKNRYKCIIYLGTSVEEKPWIEMFNYEEIPALSTVVIMFTQLKTISAAKWTYTYAGIRVYYKETYGVVQFYNFVNHMSPVQAAAAVSVAASGYENAEVTGSSEVNGFATYELNFTLINMIQGNVDTDFLAIKFPENMFNKNINVSDPVINLAGKLFVFGAANMLYFQPTANLAAGSINLKISNLQNPDYTFNLTEIEITAHEIIGNKQKQHYKFKLLREIIPCQAFRNFTVTASSNIGRENNVTYEITIVSGHKIPNEGYLKIIFPADYDSLEQINATCSLINFGSLTTCQLKTYGFDIVFNGDAFNESQTYKIYISGMNNPNIQMSSKEFTIYSQFSITNSTKSICTDTTYAPSIEIQQISKCSFAITMDEQTQSIQTNYNFAFYCETNIREESELKLILPSEYVTIYNESVKASADKKIVKQCYSNDLILRDNDCYLQISGQNVIITAKLRRFSSHANFGIQVKKLQNPLQTGTIKNFKLNITSNSVMYIQEKVPAMITVTENSYMINSTSDQIYVELQNLPITPGQPSAYIFKINRIKQVPSYIFTAVKIIFSDDFSNEISDNLECGAFLTQTKQDYYYDEILKYFSNQTTKGYTYYSFPCTASSKEVLIKEVDWLIKQKNNLYINWVVNNVPNPSSETTQELSFEYKSGTAVIYKMKANFTIQLGLPASEHYLSQDINLTSYNIKSYSSYKFYVQLSKDLIRYQKLGILITLPKAYSEVLSYQSSLEYYCQTGLNSIPGSTSECTFYNKQIMFVEYNNQKVDIQAQNTSYSFNIIISNMVNPVIETNCNSSSSELNANYMFYDIKLINLLGNEIISTNFKSTDKHNCVEFVQNLYLISLSSPSVISPGYTYDLTITLEMPSDGIIFTPTIASTNKIRFNPSQIEFSDYMTLEKNVQLIADELVKPGTYYIKWEKYEQTGFNYFTELLDTKLVVKAQNNTKKETITISNTNILGVKSTPVELLVTLSKPPSKQIKFSITPTDKKVLVVSPSTLIFNSTSSQQAFTLYAAKETNVQELTFSLTPNSAYDVYTLIETQRTIYIQEEPSGYLFKVVSIVPTEIGTNHILLSIKTSEEYSKLFYCVCYLNSVKPSQLDLVGKNYSKAQVVGSLHTSSHTSILNITGLESNTQYVLFIIGQGMHTFSQIKQLQFNTSKSPRAAIIRFQLTSNDISDNTILSAFAHTFRLSQERFVIIKKYGFDYEINSQIMNERPAIYEIMIIPDSLNNAKKPIQYARMLNDTKVAKFFQKALPYITSLDDISAYEYFPAPPQVAEEPSIKVVTYYTATIKMKFWKQCKVYGVRVCEQSSDQKLKKQKKILSQQIFKGMDQENEKLNKTKYYTYESVTEVDGSIDIFLDDLKAGMDCTAYITAGSNVPFEPADLMDDDKVRVVEFSTPENQNLN